MFSPAQLMQTMLQRAPVTTPKPLELTPGQVFKGTVVKQYPNNMALVQIGGMQVQAKMEAPLEAGQQAWMQVQPSADVVTLKMLNTPVEGAEQEASMENLLRSLGLPDTKESRAIVQALMQANLPVSKETVQAFAGVAQKLGLDQATVEAFILAVKRNLPLTLDAVAGLKAFMSEKPLGQVINSFLQQASLFLDGEAGLPGQNGSPSSSTHQVVRQLVSQLKEKVAGLPLPFAAAGEGDGTAAEIRNTQVAGNRPSADTAVRSTAVQTGQGVDKMPTGQVLSPLLSPQQQQSAGSVAPSTASRQVAPSQLSPLAAAANQAEAENSPASTVEWPGRGTGSEPSVSGRIGGNPATVLTGTSGKPMMPADASFPADDRQPLGSAQAANNRPDGQPITTEVSARGSLAGVSNASVAPSSSVRSHPIMELFRQLGIAHERDLMAQALTSGSLDAHAQKQMETVKSMLMQLTQSSAHAIPAALRESADQLLMQVTGQQLMMVQSANQSLSQIVMQIPLRSGQGEETAYVQIEAKKKGGGQLDAENCRLFFHLELQSLGTTMIDVSIVNRIVNLQIFNDTPWVDALAHGMRDSFSEQLKEVGYQLSSMRIQPIPEQKSKAQGQTKVTGALLSDYKGVDLRI